MAQRYFHNPHGVAKKSFERMSAGGGRVDPKVVSLYGKCVGKRLKTGLIVILQPRPPNFSPYQ